jgi:hypothetical protein
MPTFSFLNRTVTYNSETTIALITNGVVGPLFNLTQLYIQSPTGAPYTIFRIYKNSVLLNSLATPTVAQFTNILNQLINVVLEPGSVISISAVNLDPSQSTHAYEGSIE